MRKIYMAFNASFSDFVAVQCQDRFQIISCPARLDILFIGFPKRQLSYCRNRNHSKLSMTVYDTITLVKTLEFGEIPELSRQVKQAGKLTYSCTFT